MKIPTKKLTFDQIANKYKITVKDVNNSINDSYNKIVDKLVLSGYDIWEAVMGTKDFFEMTEKEAYDRLNIKNKKLIKETAQTRLT